MSWKRISPNLCLLLPTSYPYPCWCSYISISSSGPKMSLVLHPVSIFGVGGSGRGDESLTSAESNGLVASSTTVDLRLDGRVASHFLRFPSSFGLGCRCCNLAQVLDLQVGSPSGWNSPRSVPTSPMAKSNFNTFWVPLRWTANLSPDLWPQSPLRTTGRLEIIELICGSVSRGFLGQITVWSIAT